MEQILAAYPGARRALFRKYHLGGCSSCGFAPEETLSQLCARNGGLNVEEVMAHIQTSHETDRQLEISPKEVTERRARSVTEQWIEVLGGLWFFGAHLGLSAARPLRERLGAGFQGLYSVAVGVGFALLLYGWWKAPFIALWDPLPWTRWTSRRTSLYKREAGGRVDASVAKARGGAAESWHTNRAANSPRHAGTGALT